MGVTSKIELHSVVELAEPVEGFPAGRRGGVVDKYSDGTLLVELTDDASLDAPERLVTVTSDKLRLVEA